MKKTILLVFCCIAMTFADVHQGLKKAIDDGDYKTATNLVKKMNVQGMYLPPTLKVKDAEAIYGSMVKNYKYILSIDASYNPSCSKDAHSECSSQFLDKYVEMLCSGNTELHAKACLDWMNATPPENWSKVRNHLCNDKATVEACNLYIKNQKVDTLYKFLKDLDKKGLLNFTAMVEIDTTVEETIPPKECAENLSVNTQIIRSQIAASRNATNVIHTFGGLVACTFDYSQASVNKCLAKFDQKILEIKKMCRSGQAKRDVRKKKKSKREQKPFDYTISSFWTWLRDIPWFAMDDMWKERVKFVQKYYKNKDAYSFGDEDAWAQGLADKYSKSSDLDISYVKRACIVYSSIDKKMKKKYGIELFSCSKILSDYPTYLNEKCAAKDSSWVKNVPFWLQSQRDSIGLVCDHKTGTYRIADKFEAFTKESCEAKDSSWIKTYYVDQDSIRIVCDRETGSFRLANEFENVAGALCVPSKASWIDKTNSVVCDKNVGWRKANVFERIGGLCENPEKSWVAAFTDGRGYRQAAVCDAKIGKFREANEFETIAGALCESPEKTWIDSTNRVVCDKNTGWRYADQFEKIGGLCENPEKSWIVKDEKTGRGIVVCDAKIGKFREADEFETIAGELCDTPEKIWMKNYKDDQNSEVTFVCDKNSDRFRKMTEIEILVGLCDDSRFGEEKYLMTCTHDGWEDSKKANTAGANFTKGKYVKGKINSKYAYFKDFQSDSIYRATKIGKQVWMAENLQGGNSEYLDIARAWNSCPEGWHLPDTTEWSTLYREVGKNASALMLKDLPDWPQATDAHGFSVVPEGFLDREAGRQALASKDAFFWTYTKNEKGGLSGAYVFHISGNDAAIEGERFFKRRQYNVRCIRDR